jgi:hypothetical protein
VLLGDDARAGTGLLEKLRRHHGWAAGEQHAPQLTPVMAGIYIHVWNIRIDLCGVSSVQPGCQK